MDRDIAASLEVLKGELTRLDGMLARAATDQTAALAAARLRLRHAVAAMETAGAASPDAATSHTPAPLSLRERMVAIGPLPPTAFRTRVKIKEPERPLARSSAPLAEPARAAASPPDPLTRIRGIDAALAGRLRALGVTSYADIASWSAADVKLFAADLGLGRRISRQNWIEQAALLSLREPIARAVPIEAPVVSIAAPDLQVEPVEPPQPAATIEPVPTVAAGAISVGTLDATSEPVPFEPMALATAETDGAAEVGTRLEVADAAADNLPADAEISNPAMLEQLAPAPVAEALVPLEPEPTTNDPSPTAIAEPEPAPASPGLSAPEPETDSAPADDLTLIKGIDDAIAATLHEHGITRFTEIAGWQRADIAHVGGNLALSVPLSRLGWIEQAALLARGDLTHHARRVTAGDYIALAPYPPAEELPPIPTRPTVAGPAPSQPEPVAPAPEPSAPVITPPPASDLAAVTIVPNMTATASAPEVFTEPPAAAAPHVPTAPAIAAAAPHLNIEDEEFPELSVDEAEVMIVPRRKAAPTIQVPPRPATPSARSLMARLRRVPPPDDIDPATYAGYRDHVEEASVEIVRTEPAAKKAPGPASNPPPTSRP